MTWTAPLACRPRWGGIPWVGMLPLLSLACVVALDVGCRHAALGVHRMKAGCLGRGCLQARCRLTRSCPCGPQLAV